MVDTILAVVGLYIGLGAAFAIAFAAVGCHRLDAAARHAPVRVRIVLMPGATLLWPLLLAKWVRRRS